MVNNQIDLIFQCYIFRRLFGKHRQEGSKCFVAFFLLLKKLADIFQNIFLHGVDVSNHPFIFLVFLLYRADVVPDGKHADFVVQLFHAFFGRFIQFADIPHNAACFFLHCLGFFFNVRFYVLRQIVIFFFADCLALYQRHEIDAGICRLNLKIILPRHRAHIVHQRAAFLIEGMEQLTFLFFIIVCAEHLLQFNFQKLHKLLHILLKLLSQPRFKAQRKRTAGILEIINIAPIGRDGLSRRQLFRTGAGIRCFSRTGRSGHINVISLHLHSKAEIQRLHSALLPDDALQRRDFLCRPERKFLRGTASFQLCIVQFQMLCHDASTSILQNCRKTLGTRQNSPPFYPCTVSS